MWWISWSAEESCDSSHLPKLMQQTLHALCIGDFTKGGLKLHCANHQNPLKRESHTCSSCTSNTVTNVFGNLLSYKAEEWNSTLLLNPPLTRCAQLLCSCLETGPGPRVNAVIKDKDQRTLHSGKKKKKNTLKQKKNPFVRLYRHCVTYMLDYKNDSSNHQYLRWTGVKWAIEISN